MKRRWLRSIAPFLLLLALLAGTAGAEQRAKYVFLFIGDGTSFPQRNVTEYFLAARKDASTLEPQIAKAEGKIRLDDGIADFKPAIDHLLMNTFPAQGLSSTYSFNSLITDSSSSGTAIATGKKTQDGVVAMDPLGKEGYVSMAKLAKARGKKVGIISTVSIEHATPAAFYANAPSRNLYYEIAQQIPASGFEYFAGGGFKQPKGSKKDQKDVAEIIREGGYKVYNTREDFDKLKKGDEKVVTINPALDNNAALPYTIDRDPKAEISLAEFLAKGIELLDNPEGFFIMAEGGKIDWACHANDAVAAIHDVIALDEAVKVAYDFYRKHPEETLIVVTGDHETGGLALGYAGTRYDAFLKRLEGQKGSYLAFNAEIKKFKKDNPEGRFADMLPVIEDFFGLKYHPQDQMKKLSEAAAKGDPDAVAALEMALTDYELGLLEKAFAMTMTPQADRPTKDDAYYTAYGSYEPLTVTLTHVLNHKAGIAWTSFSHSGLPTPVSAVGVGCENFNGYFDNTDIFRKVVAIAQYQQ